MSKVHHISSSIITCLLISRASKRDMGRFSFKNKILRNQLSVIQLLINSLITYYISRTKYPSRFSPKISCLWLSIQSKKIACDAYKSCLWCKAHTRSPIEALSRNLLNFNRNSSGLALFSPDLLLLTNRW